jgi:cobalt-zinc-cadmium efflux system outer membrane protein
MRGTRLLACLSVCAAAACATPRSRSAVDVRSFDRAFVPGSEAGAGGRTPDELDQAILAAPTLSLDGAIVVALAHRADLQVLAAEIDRVAAGRTGALLYPNPEAELSASHEEAGGEQIPEIWIGLSQPIVLSDRRQLGADAADAAADAAAWDLVARRIDVIAEVRAAFYAVVALDSSIALAAENVALAAEFLRVAEIRLQAERVAEIEVLRARAEVETAGLAVETAQARAAAARARLAGAMGVPGATLPPCAALPEPPLRLPSAEELEAKAVEESPRVEAAQARVRAADLAAERAAAEAVPDLTVSAGYGQSLEPLASLWSVGVGIPLPIFDRNQGAKAEAEAVRAMAAADLLAAEADVRTALRETLAEHGGAAANLRSIREDLVPLADEAYRRAEIGYREGQTDYLALLDARRARVDARIAEIDALLAVRLALVRIESLVGPLFAPEEVQP